MNMADIAIIKNRKYQKYKGDKVTTRWEVGTDIGCLVRNLEDTALSNALGGILYTSLLEYLGEPLEVNRGNLKW